MASRIAVASHENSNLSGIVSTPINAGAYTQQLVGQTDFLYNKYNRMSAPTVYTHPVTSMPGMIRRGFQNQHQPNPRNIKAFPLRGYNPDRREVLYAPRRNLTKK